MNTTTTIIVINAIMVINTTVPNYCYYRTTPNYKMNTERAHCISLCFAYLCNIYDDSVILRFDLKVIVTGQKCYVISVAVELVANDLCMILLHCNGFFVFCYLM